MSTKKFKELEQEFDLPKMEREVLEYWKSIDILNYTYQQRKDSEEKVYYDGPITANGRPHYGHAITWTMKDVVPRFWTMQDKFVLRNMGWDCQGILVEYEVEKDLGFKDKTDVEKYGIENFNNKCKETVLTYRKAMLDYETRIGRLIDRDAEYATMDKAYIESIWWALKELYEKGLLYEGHKVVAYSTRSGMTMSTHEVAEGGYDEVIDTAVTLKFKLAGEDSYVLAWTTTPWTLPGNLLLSVGKKIKYVKIKLGTKHYILAKDALERILGGQNFEIIEEFLGSELIGKEYIPLFDYYSDRKENGAFKIVHGDHVTTEEGTGVVHLAPYGMEDFDILMDLKIPLFDYLDEQGLFNSDTPDLEGMFYKKANNKILELLQEKDLLFHKEDYPHQMPIDYRTDTPLIYKPIKSWYVNVGKIKEKLLEEAKKVNFVPASEGKRFSAWIESARDWSLSRKRFWGTPLPLWINDKTGETIFIGSYEELSKLSGKELGEDFDPHKPYVDEITWEGKEGGVFRRVPEVIDVWFDSGSMPYAQYHYPFENEELFAKRFPAEYISEGDDQIRLWFYTMFVLGVALFGQSPFKNVVVIGMLGDETGKKMSKSKGNYPPVEEVFADYGSDMFRYFLLTSPITQAEASRFSYDLLKETKKEYFTMLYNSYKYFITYANSNNYEPVKGIPSSDNILDKWIMARLKQTSNTVIENMEKYLVMPAARQLRPFVNDLSTWYIRRSRDRISGGDKQALDTLYYVLLELAKLSAPFTPFLSETFYKSLNGDELSGLKSVHLEKLLDIQNLTEEEKNLLTKMEQTREAVSLALAVRSEKEIKIRQPLGKLYIQTNNKNEKKTEVFEDLIKDEINIHEIIFSAPADLGEPLSGDNFNIWLDTNITEDLRIEGEAREMIRSIQALRKKNNLSVDDEVKVVYQDTKDNKIVVERFGEEIKGKVSAVSLEPGEELLVEKL